MSVSRRWISACWMVGLLAGAAGAVNIETVPVGNPGNAGELSGYSAGGAGSDRICGAVAYTYNIGKYEVTAGQYCEFLNKVAGVDTYGLYGGWEMSDPGIGCGITQSGNGSVGNPFTYSVATGFVNRPVNLVSYWDACRFANWLHNGQPTGRQGPGTTETGAYTLNGYNSNGGGTIGRNANAKWAIPNEDEWYKAAYHKNDGITGNYFDSPTSSDGSPTAESPPGGTNSANFNFAVSHPTDVGAYTDSVSPYGTFDQGGNVREWNEAAFSDSDRGVRGGSLYDGGGCGNPLLARSRYTDAQPAFQNSTTGFRVVEIPEPATLGLMVMGAWAALGRKRM